MKKILSLCLFISFSANAQIAIESINFLSIDKKMILAAIDSSICVVRQDYVLRDTGNNPYGRGNRSYFGRKFQLGVIYENKIWVNKIIATPWENDKSFEPYIAADTLRPSLTKAAVRFRGSEKFEEREDSLVVQNPTDNLVWFNQDSSAKIPVFRGQKIEKGWLVIVSSAQELSENEESKLEYTIYHPAVEFNEGEAVVNKVPRVDNILGGVYYAYEVTAGKIQFSIAGILNKNEDDWIIKALHTEKKKSSQPGLTIINEGTEHTEVEGKENIKTEGSKKNKKD